ncbi:MAG TPA: hypothetical protein VNK26_07170 [Pyrinomonadaceae bacterium]|nr:hypothetical protein [Pyrinomonadaceae bacterium]
MKLERTKLHILRKVGEAEKLARTGISLHCHTEHSREMLDFIPHYAEKLPIIATFWRRERDRYIKRNGKGINFNTAYWSPPLPPEEVFAIERKQIESAGLNPFVSLTDHDNIEASFLVEQRSGVIAPVSLEWTVPFEYGFFHVGVHNLPRESANEISERLLDFTFNSGQYDENKLNDLFAYLNDFRSILIVLNHPLWDIEIVGQKRHEELLKSFIKKHINWIHAFEINGFRSWSENKAVIEMAEYLGLPVVTGGDRHGRKPNTVVNLTNSASFEEFVDEIRIDKRSTAVLMPAYEYPLHWRQLESFAEILSHYPHFRIGRQNWWDRVFVDTGDGKGLCSLSGHGWKGGGPKWLRASVKVLGFLGGPKMRPLFRIARKKKDRLPRSIESARFVSPDLGDIAPPKISETWISQSAADPLG